MSTLGFPLASAVSNDYTRDMTNTQANPKMGFSQDFIAAAFGTRHADECKARIGDNRREHKARSEGR